MTCGGAGAATRHAQSAPGPIAAARAFIANYVRQKSRPSAQVVDVVLVDEVPLQLVRGSARAERDTAQVIAPVLYSYEVKGAVVVQPARMAITLRKSEGGWRISGWAFAGGEPPVGEAAEQARFLPQG